MKTILVSIIIFAACTNVFAQEIEFRNIDVEQRPDGSGLVDIFYDLDDSKRGSYDISVEVSFDSGDNFEVLDPQFLSGDLFGIWLGSDYHIIWNGLESHPDIYSEVSLIKLIANLTEDNGEPGTVTDIDGNVYPTIIIGNQEWMAVNLKVTKYNNGDDLLTDLDDYTLYSTEESEYAIYDYELLDNIDSPEAVKNAYGLLYNWHAVVDERNICPAGWHVPSSNEWNTFIDYLTTNYGYNTNNVALPLRSCRQPGSPLGGECDTNEHPYWVPGGGVHGTDEWGFGALGIGFRVETGGYAFGDDSMGFTAGYWWTSTPSQTGYAASIRYMFNDFGMLLTDTYHRNLGVSVRCIRSND